MGTEERYDLSEWENGITTLNVHILTDVSYESLLNETWPKALQKLKEICEQ